MATNVFINGSDLFYQDNVFCHTAKHVQEWVKEHGKEFKVLTWLQDSLVLNLIQHLSDHEGII